MSCLILRLFGPPQIERDGALVHIGRRKATALLVYLAITRRAHGRDELAALGVARISYGHGPWAAAMDWLGGQARAVFAGEIVPYSRTT